MEELLLRRVECDEGCEMGGCLLVERALLLDDSAIKSSLWCFDLIDRFENWVGILQWKGWKRSRQLVPERSWL